MKRRKIHLQKFPATSAGGKTPLLFIHGGYVDSSCWEYHFVPFFQQHGYDCYTIDLSGHGRSEGRDQIHEFGIDQYVADLQQAVQEIGGPVTLIGHSMGSRVVERFLASGDAQAAIFLSPVPATGTVGSAVRLSLRHPNFLDAMNAVTSGQFSEEVAALLQKIYFSPEMPASEARKYLPMIGAESQLAVSELAMPEFRLSYRRRNLPTLVLGGTEDAVFPASDLHFMASTWNADLHRAEGLGHMLMLDPKWEDVARHIHAWIGKRVCLPA